MTLQMRVDKDSVDKDKEPEVDELVCKCNVEILSPFFFLLWQHCCYATKMASDAIDIDRRRRPGPFL